MVTLKYIVTRTILADPCDRSAVTHLNFKPIKRSVDVKTPSKTDCKGLEGEIPHSNRSLASIPIQRIHLHAPHTMSGVRFHIPEALKSDS